MNNIDDNICTICLTTMKNQKLLVELSCKHKFCKTCLDSWIDSKYTHISSSNIEEVSVCPLCRDSSVDMMCMNCHKLYDNDVTGVCECYVSTGILHNVLDKILYSIFILLIFIFVIMIYPYIHRS